MTPDEFQRWFAAHCSAFAGLRKYLSAEDGAITQLADCLGDVTFDDAREATRLMNRSDGMEPPPFGEHGRTVRRLARGLVKEREAAARELAKPRTSRDRLYSCRLCWDSGIVTVANIWVSKNGHAPIEKFLRGTHPLPVCGVRCCCPIAGGKQPAFDPDKMFRIARFVATMDETEAFRSWWSGGHQTGNRVAAFDAFNQGGEF